MLDIKRIINRFEFENHLEYDKVLINRIKEGHNQGKNKPFPSWYQEGINKEQDPKILEIVQEHRKYLMELDSSRIEPYSPIAWDILRDHGNLIKKDDINQHINIMQEFDRVHRKYKAMKELRDFRKKYQTLINSLQD